MSILDGVINERRVLLDGLEIPAMRRTDYGITTDDGITRQVSTAGAIALGDGTVVNRLGSDLGTCALCWAELSAFVEQGLVDRVTASYKSLHHISLLVHTETGLSVCGRHRRTIQTPTGPVVVSTLEAGELERQARLQRPMEVVKFLFMDPRP